MIKDIIVYTILLISTRMMHVLLQGNVSIVLSDNKIKRKLHQIVVSVCMDTATATSQIDHMKEMRIVLIAWKVLIV